MYSCILFDFFIKSLLFCVFYTSKQDSQADVLEFLQKSEEQLDEDRERRKRLTNVFIESLHKMENSTANGGLLHFFMLLVCKYVNNLNYILFSCMLVEFFFLIKPCHKKGFKFFDNFKSCAFSLRMT